MAVTYQAILFDFDGVLADTEPLHYECWREVLSDFGIPFEWARYQAEFIGVADREVMARLCREAGADIEEVMAEHPRKKALFQERVKDHRVIHEDVRRLIADLKSHYKLAVVTSSGQSEIEPILANTAMLRYFDTAVYGGDVQRLKPAPDPYALAAKRLGIERALVVEDSAAGIASGRAAGFDVLEITTPAEVPRRVREVLASGTHVAGPYPS